MFHSLVGNIGHFSAILAFVASLLAAFSYFNASKNEQDWLMLARASFFVHFLGIIGVVASLFSIIYNHYYEYYYAWSHSSNNLPTHYMISCFWEGQEGSFLLWMFWHGVLGIMIIFFHKKWEVNVMTVFAVVQAFLASMILGIVFFDMKFGSSPFILLRDFMTDAPIFKSQPEFVPKDGTGLNPLLQNYWMVIHPPTLFLGFATTLVPFSFCIAGLWKNDFKEWIKPALPWAHFSALILGLGILMGGYWAYETLNFGGYWNWDPVENAVYVPWLVLIGAIHAMIIFKKNNTALKTAIILVISTFLLILYSTFLTRSGILGNASVHSFTDLGLSGQLLVYLLFFVLWAMIILIVKWKKIPSQEQDTSIWSREFWIFMGITTLCLAAFQIIATTSIPVYNSLLSSLNIKSNLALPADQVSHYSKFQIWFSAFIALFSGTGQFFYWNKMDKEKLYKAISTPIIITLLTVASVITISKINNFSYIILLTFGVYSFVSNLFILINLLRKSPTLSGGAVAHIGIALMLIGVLYSAGYSKVISNNTTGLLYSKEFTADMNRENILLWRNESINMNEYKVKYLGPRIEIDNIGYINKEKIAQLQNLYQAIVTENIEKEGKTILKKGDTVSYQHENTYFEIEFTKENGDKFVLYPRAQVNKEMGLLASPDIKKMLGKDLYTHVSSIPDPNDEKEWSEVEEKTVALGDTFLINDYYAKFENVERINEVEGFKIEGNDAAVKATIKIYEKEQTTTLEPIFLIHNQMIGKIAAENVGIGARISLNNIDPKTGSFTLGLSTTQKDWIILKAMEKPYIDLLWLGSILVMFGFGIAIVRRRKESNTIIN